eukprot:g16744.t2
MVPEPGDSGCLGLGCDGRLSSGQELTPPTREQDAKENSSNGSGKLNNNNDSNNNKRLRESFLAMLSAQADVRLEEARGEAEELGRREEAAAAAAGRSAIGGSSGGTVRAGKRPRSIGPQRAAAAVAAAAAAAGLGQTAVDDSKAKREGKGKGKLRSCHGGESDQEACPPTRRRAQPPAAERAPSVLRERRPEALQQQQQQQSQGFCPIASALQRKEWERGGIAAAAAAPDSAAGAAASVTLHGPGTGYPPSQQQHQRQQQFVVMGLVGEFGGQVLLLPTSRDSEEVMAACPPGTQVPLPWTDSNGSQHIATLTRVKAKPVVPNPLLMLATLLAWVEELPPGSLSERRRIVLPECLLPNRSCNNSCCSINNTTTSTGFASSNGGGEREGVELSLGATWLLAHLLFGRDAGGQVTKIFTARTPPKGEVCDVCGFWDPDREIMARVALGLLKTGPMAAGMRPPAMPALFDAARGPVSLSATKDGDDGDGDGDDDVVWLGGRGSGSGRMRGVVGEVCVELCKLFIEALRGAGGILQRVCKKEIVGNKDSPLVWSGPMAKALALLGGSRSVPTSRHPGGTPVDGGGGCWMASLSKPERLGEAACLGLKNAARHVADLVRDGMVEALEKQNQYAEAVKLLRLLLRRDQRAAGPEYVHAPDLSWAADWVTSNLRGAAYTRLVVDLKHLCATGARLLEVAREACEDDDVRGGERVDLEQRYEALRKKFGDSQETPGKENGKHKGDGKGKEDCVVVALRAAKQGNVKTMKGGRKMYLLEPGVGQNQLSGPASAMTVEEVLIREWYLSGGWLGVHCEYELIQFLATLCLWDVLFDGRVSAAVPHCITNRPVDLSDKYMCTRRPELPVALRKISQLSPEQLWAFLGRQYERYQGARAIWCDWSKFPKQQVMEIAVAFGGPRLSALLRTFTGNLAHLRCGFPDVVLWRPRGIEAAAGDENGGDFGWRSKTHFGLDWRGYRDQGWEVEVVEVKSKSDVTSQVQEAWLRELKSARVPARVTRVWARSEWEESGCEGREKGMGFRSSSAQCKRPNKSRPSGESRDGEERSCLRCDRPVARLRPEGRVSCCCSSSSSSSSSSRSSSRSSAWGFVAPSLPALPAGRSTRAGLSRCGARSAASPERRPCAAAGGRRTRSSLQGLHTLAAFSSDENANSNPPTGEQWGAAGRARGEGGIGSPRSRGCSSVSSRTTLLALSAAASPGGDGGDSGGLGALGLDPESVARAREAAKNDDYEWFMEFIGGDDEENERSDGGGGGGGGEGTARPRNTLNNGGELQGDGRGRKPAVPPINTRRRAPIDYNGGRLLGGAGREAPDLTDRSMAADPAPAARRRLPQSGRGFRGPPDGADGRRRGARARGAPADSAYDYDLDEEFDQEPGRGGWDYDPGLSAGIGARRRGVEVDKVRAKTKPASMRMPLEEDLEAVVEGVRGEEGKDRQPDLVAAADFEPVDAEKAGVLTGDLGYTEPEVSCMDPDMADLAIERGIRRPAAGMPLDWVAVGMPPPPPPRATPAPAASSQTYFGEGATGAGVKTWGRRGGGVDGDALDLDAILGDGYEYDEINGGGARQAGPLGTRPRPTPGDYEGGRPPRPEQQPRRSRYSPEDSEYADDVGRREGLRGDRVRGGYGDYSFDDRAPSRAGRGRYEDDFAGGGGGGGRRSGRNPRPQRKEPEMSAAERYEREIFGGLGGEEGGGGGPRRWGDEEEERDRIWTGVGPDGPWPTMEEFTKLLREETEVRLGLVGPWAAEIVSLENRFRLQAYEKWLEILDKGIGETLEEAGVFDAAFTNDEDDGDDDYDDERDRRRPRSNGGGADTNNLYDSYTNYGSYAGDGRGSAGGGWGGGSGRYNPEGTLDERGLDYDDRLYGDSDRRQRTQKPRGWDDERGPSRRKFDVGSFLRDGAQSIMQPAAGMEAKAAEFERRYPGRTRSNALGYDEDDGDANVTGRDRFRADDIDYGRQQPQQSRGRSRARREGGDVDDMGYRAGGGSRDTPPARSEALRSVHALHGDDRKGPCPSGSGITVTSTQIPLMEGCMAESDLSSVEGGVLFAGSTAEIAPLPDGWWAADDQRYWYAILYTGGHDMFELRCRSEELASHVHPSDATWRCIVGDESVVFVTGSEFSVTCGCDDAPEPAIDPQPHAQGGSICEDSGILGIASKWGSVCCVAECRICGGAGCASASAEAGLTADDCCVTEILADGEDCFESGTAPCYIDDEGIETDSEVEDDEDPCVAALSSYAVEKLYQYDRRLYFDPECENDTANLPYCNFMGLGQGCRGCFMSLAGARKYRAEVVADDTFDWGEEAINFCPGTNLENLKES